ncbi:nucleotide-binding universal stress UspA family protein [Actimicrobium sp. GrIS 1.19]|uniref:universal stress protein n=1 Tax=Actimicrobium sp. GrIS 1.19 TaxID=3071708 RepID=UPI002DF7489D|nr:nucleotide-binding universal stress UspA family protein [Actimicrobium sp. GrIS 1.19]
MSYKTILVHLDEAPHLDARIEFAAQLALANEAHLIGSATTGVSRYFYESLASGVVDPGIAPYLAQLRQQAEQRIAHFEQLVKRIGVPSFETRLADDEAENSIATQARYCDLVVVGQYDPDGVVSSVYADLPEHIAVHGGCPVLILPHTVRTPPAPPRQVLIAWNGAPEALRAVRDALPLLRAARVVDIAVFNADARPDVHGQEPGADLALFLARHQVKANVMQEQIEIDFGAALLSLAADRGSDLLVMGCYGHSRMRETLLGGVSRTILESMTLPVLMTH